MEPEHPLPHSQEAASNPTLSHINPVHAPIPLPEDPLEYYPPIYSWVFQVVSFPQVSYTKTLYEPLLLIFI
jgi:hypothetical protein